MASALDRLLEIASPALSARPADLGMDGPGGRADLRDLLPRRNGFVAFESALLVLPCSRRGPLPGVIDWSEPGGWRRHYPGTEHSPSSRSTHFGPSDDHVNAHRPA